jgi:hypothetical protein
LRNNIEVTCRKFTSYPAELDKIGDILLASKLLLRPLHSLWSGREIVTAWPVLQEKIVVFPLSLFGREAIRALSRNKLRSALSAVGITIGIGAVVCVVAIGTAGSQRAEQQLQNLGDNLVWVEAGSRNVNGVRSGSHGMTTLTMEDAETIVGNIVKPMLSWGTAQ